MKDAKTKLFTKKDEQKLLTKQKRMNKESKNVRKRKRKNPHKISNER